MVALTFALRRPLQAGLERVSTRLARWVGGLLASITKLPLGVQLAILAYSAFILVLELSGVYLLHRAVHLDIGYLHFMLGASLAIIVGNLPITVGGFGSREAVLMMVFTQVGSSETVLSAGLLWSAIFYLLPVLVGLPLVTLMFRQLARDRRSEAGV